MNRPIIAIAGGSGDLGARIVRAMVKNGTHVRALLRQNANSADIAKLQALGAEVVLADVTQVDDMAKALAGTSCVVSALNGLSDVIIDRQTILLNAAVKADVPRFISSDYSEDFTTTTPGENRNLDLRRDFMAIADKTPMAVTTILNGAFMDMLGAEMPIIQNGISRVLYWRSADQRLDFTTKNDVAAFTAKAAIDETTPRILRVAGDSVSARQIAEILSVVNRKPFKPLWVGSIGMLNVVIAIAKRIAPQHNDVFPAWQGMQYMRDMYSGAGKLNPLNNDRYGDLTWTSVTDHLTKLKAAQPPKTPVTSPS